MSDLGEPLQEAIALQVIDNCICARVTPLRGKAHHIRPPRRVDSPVRFSHTDKSGKQPFYWYLVDDDDSSRALTLATLKPFHEEN